MLPLVCSPPQGRGFSRLCELVFFFGRGRLRLDQSASQPWSSLSLLSQQQRIQVHSTASGARRKSSSAEVYWWAALGIIASASDETRTCLHRWCNPHPCQIFRTSRGSCRIGSQLCWQTCQLRLAQMAYLCSLSFSKSRSGVIWASHIVLFLSRAVDICRRHTWRQYWLQQ